MTSRSGSRNGLDAVVLETLGDAVIVLDGDGQILLANPATAAVLGWAAAELVGEPITTIIPERLRLEHRAGFGRFVATGEAEILGIPVQVPARRPDGSEVTVELVITAFPRPSTAGGPVAVAAIRRRLDSELGGERGVGDD